MKQVTLNVIILPR